MKHKIGDVCPQTGKIFAGYGPSYKNGEWWTSPKTYRKRLEREAERARSIYKKNPDKFLDRSRAWRKTKRGDEWCKEYDACRTQIKAEQARKRYKENQEYRDKLLEKSRIWRKSKRGREWDSKRKGTPEELRKRRERLQRRREQDKAFVIKSRVVKRIRRVCSEVGISRSQSLSKYCGCNPQTLRWFIENQFQGGMSWDNMDEWHVDHFFPVSLAKDERGLRQYNHFTNLRPSWPEENLRKGDKLPDISEVVERDRLVTKLISRLPAQMGGVQTQGMEQ